MIKHSIRAFIRNALAEAERKSAYEEVLRTLKVGLFSFQSNRKYTYKVTISSSWTDHGEKSISCTKKASLEEVFRFAARTFKEENHRTDIQGIWHVSVVLSEGCEVVLSRDFWGHLEEKYKN